MQMQPVELQFTWRRDTLVRFVYALPNLSGHTHTHVSILCRAAAHAVPMSETQHKLRPRPHTALNGT